MAPTVTRDTEEWRRTRVRDFNALMWHVGTFVIVNGMLWILDVVQGGGLEWAYWTTIFWGVGLAFHALAFMLDDGGLADRKYEEHLDEVRQREAQVH